MEKITTAEIRQAATLAGSHFFEPSTLRFFRSRIAAVAYGDGEAWYFVTSEQFRGSNGYTAPRRYTVRRVTLSPWTVSTLGGFQAFTTSAAATRFAKLAAVVKCGEAVKP